MLNAAFTTAIRLNDVDLSEVVLELGIKQPVFRTLEYFGYEITPDF
jgi:hypothetical protein